MKMKNLFLLLALLGITASCTNEQDVKFTQGGHPGEIQIMFNGNGAQTEYPGTRAIATDSENTIEKLDVYIFASTAENGTYYFVEKWSKGATDDATAHTFTLQGAGANRKASVFPTEFKGYPYLKLYCVANAENLYDNSGNQLTFTPLTTDASGNVVTTSVTQDVGTGGTAATVGIKNALLGKIQEGAPILTPLPMSGTATTMISSDYSLITVEMVRRVARFDIVNDAMTSNLTIEKITPLNARANYPLFKEEYLATNIMPLQDKYPTIDYTALPNANKGTTQGAFYVYPTAKTDQMQLLIEGRYSGTPVSYYVKIANTPEPTVTVPVPAAVFIDVKTNNRYTLRIQDVRKAGINVLFDIEDWTSGGGMIIKPNNNIIPVVNEVKNVTGAPVTNAATAPTDSILHIKDIGKFTIEATANGITNATITPITPGVEKITWFTKSAVAAELPENNVTMTPEGLKKTKLTFNTVNTTAAATAGQKALLTLYNQSASKDSAFERTYIVALPEIDVLSIKYQDANPYKNYVDNTDPANPIVYQYQVAANTSLVFDVDEYTLSAHTVTVGGQPVGVTAGSYNNSKKQLTITTSAPTTMTNVVGTFELKNTNDPTKVTKATIIRVPVDVTPSTTENNVTITKGATDWAYNVEVDVAALQTAQSPTDNMVTFDITVNSKEGMTTVSAINNSWVKSIVKKSDFDRTTGDMTYTVTIDSSSAVTTNIASTIAQDITGATALTLTFKKKTP